MKILNGMACDINGNREEKLPDFSSDFPYVYTQAELDQYPERRVPWHWHGACELFYIYGGALEYTTPGGSVLFPEGSGGFVNANVLHRTRLLDGTTGNVQLLHLFDASIVAGQPGSRADCRYVQPLLTCPGLELIALFPDNLKHMELLHALRESFLLREDAFGYELRLRAALSAIWLELLSLSRTAARDALPPKDGAIKAMMLCVQARCAEKLSVADIAAAALCSERECFRTFDLCLHMTPGEYLKSYRLQKACRLLTGGDAPVSEIGLMCGLGGSYFVKLFHEHFGCSPAEYRQRWRLSRGTPGD